MRTISRPKIVGACLAAAVLLLVFPASARADEAVLVSNMGENTAANKLGTTRVQIAQGFTTGATQGGYALGSIEVRIAIAQNTSSNDVTVSVYEADAMNLPGGTLVCTLDKSSWGGTGIKRFGAASCGNLTVSTLYFVVMDYDDSGGNPFQVHLTQSDDEDTSALGWNIANVAHLRYETGSNTNWQANSTGRSIQIRVRAANTPPTVTDTPTDPLTVTTNEDTDYPFKATDFNFLDADSNDELASVKIATLPTAGTLTLSDNAVKANDDVTANDIGNLKYTPVTNANGTPYATFGFTVSDGLHDSASATMTINVTAVNDEPVVSGPITLSVAENTPSDMKLATYMATDEESNTFVWTPGETLSGVDDSTEFIIMNGELSFASSRDFEDPEDTGKDNVYEVRVQAFDGDKYGGLDVTITVTDVEVAAEDDTATTDEDTVVVIDVVANDTDDPDEPDDPWALSVSGVGTPASGTVASTGNAGSTVDYTPAADFHGTDTFTYTVSNGADPPVTATGTVTVTVNSVNDEPVATADTPTTNEDQAVVIRVLENDTDVDGDTLAVTDVGTPANGAAGITDNSTTITYTPTAGYIGEDNFFYEISDGSLTSRSRVTVTVTKNADLSNLTITGGSLTPTFVADTRSYAVEVAHSVSSMTVTPITSAPIATVTVNGTPVDSGDSFEVALPAGTGQYTITVAVTNEDTTNTYTIEIFRLSDRTRPTVAIETEASTPVTEPFGVTIIFSEAVMGFERSEIAVTNGSVTDFSGSAPTYKAEITPSKSGEVIVEVGANVAEDGAGNGNQAAEPFVIEADLERPEVTIEGPTEPVGLAGFEVTITFSKAVDGFELEDIRVTNGTASNFIKISPQEYTATITPEGIGEVRVEVPEDAAEDGAGNGNQAAEPFEVETKLAVSYQEQDYTAREGGEAVTVTVKLSQGWDEELAIPIRVTRPEETEAGDYTVEELEDWDAQEGTGTFTFAAEETEQTFTITANHDGDGDDETVELGFGELPEIVMAGEPAVATVTLEDKGLVELEVSFTQAEYQIKEGQQADIEVTVSPAADRRVEVPLVVALQGGATDEDYRGVPAKVVFEEGESEGTIAVEVLADEVNDPGEGIVLSFGELPAAVSGGEISQTTVHFTQRRTAGQFSQTLEVMLAVLARSTAASAQTAIEGRFERHRQWGRLGAAGGAVPTVQPGSDHSVRGLGQGESQRIGSESPEGAGRRNAEDPVVPSAEGTAGARVAMGSSGESGERESGVQGARLQNVSLGGLAGLFGYGQGDAGVSTGSGKGPSRTGPIVGLGGQSGYGQDRFQGSGTGDASLRSGLTEYSGVRDQGFSLAGASFEMPLGKQEQGRSTSWVPVLWGQGDLQHFNGDLDRFGMNYRGRLDAAHVGLDLYANDKMLAGLSFMRSWGDMDYTDDGVDGVLESDLNTFHPYLYWQPNERVSMWGIGGLGQGQVDVKEPGRTHDFDADFRMLAGGVRAMLCSWPCNELALRADGFTAQLETEAAEDIAKVRGEAHRARLMLEWVYDRPLSAGRSLSLKLEGGGRWDGGDADRGAGVETGFRLGYLDANHGLDVALHGRTLVVHESDYRDWGLGVQASWDPGQKQRGFRASVTSSWGQDGGGRTTLWDNADAVMRPAGMGAMGMGAQYRIKSEVAYAGMKAPGIPGLLTPYSRLRWAGQGRELALGTAWSLSAALPAMLQLEAMRRESGTGPADLGVSLRVSIPF